MRRGEIQSGPRLENMYVFPTRSCERLDLVRWELLADPKSGPSCKKCELQIKIDINAIFVKCLSGDKYNALFQVEPKALSKGGLGNVIPLIQKVLSADLTCNQQVVLSFESFCNW